MDGVVWIWIVSAHGSVCSRRGDPLLLQVLLQQRERGSEFFCSWQSRGDCRNVTDKKAHKHLWKEDVDDLHESWGRCDHSSFFSAEP